MKPLFCALALCTMLAPAFAQTQPKVWVEPYPEVQLIGEATQTNDGLNISPITVPVNDVAQMLQIKMWRFRIQTPRPLQTLDYRLELRIPQGKPVSLASGTIGFYDQQDVKLVCGIRPRGDEDFTKAETLKLYFRTHALTSNQFEGGIGRGGGGGNVEFKNAIRDLKFDSYSGGDGDWAFVAKNGDIHLMSFDNWGNPPRSELVLVLTAKTPQAEK